MREDVSEREGERMSVREREIGCVNERERESVCECIHQASPKPNMASLKTKYIIRYKLYSINNSI